MDTNVMLSGFMGLKRRSEKASPETLRKTFVKAGSLIELLSIIDNQAIFGRRGTGKTHVLQYLGTKMQSEGDIAVYIDLSNLGSSGSIYADATRDVGERATRLLVDTLLAIHESLFESVVNSDEFDLSQIGPVLDQFADAATRVRVVGTVEKESGVTHEEKQGESLKGSISAGAKGLSATVEGSSSDSDVERFETRRRESGHENYVLHFGEISRALNDLTKKFENRRFWVLLDEWSNLPLDLQPYLADLLRRTLFVLQGITVKIAAIEYRSSFMLRNDNGSYLGIELGADIATNVNLDDFMVFDNDVERSKEFYCKLLQNHLSEAGHSGLKEPRDIIKIGFSQENVFAELVRSGEGVPRDFINILSLAAQYTGGGERISMNHLRRAALTWYQTGKANPLRSRERCNALLEWIVEKVIKRRKTRAFLVNSRQSSKLLEELFDARVVHVIKRRVSSNDAPGERFEVFKLDYGCYVDLMGTVSAPRGLFEATSDDGNSEYIEVPKDDYRSIRRAILDLNEFDEALF